MPLPTNKPLDLKDLEPKTNAYVDNKTRYSMEVPMLQTTDDGRMLHLPMVVLNPREQREVESKAYADARACFKDVPKKDEPGMESFVKIMDDCRAAYTILYAVRVPGDLNKKWFMDKQQIEDTYTLDEMGTLCNHYVTVRLNQPYMKLLDVSDPNMFQNVIEMIKKEGSESDFFLNGLTTHSVNQLLKYLVSQLPNSPKDNGLSGEP